MGAELHHFKTIAQGFIPCSQSSSTCSTAPISPWMLIVCLRHLLVKEWIQSAEARICAHCCGFRRVSRSLPLLVLCCSSDTQNFFGIGKTVQKRIVDMNPAHVCRAKLFRGNGVGSAAHYFVGGGAWGTA